MEPTSPNPAPAPNSPATPPTSPMQSATITPNPTSAPQSNAPSFVTPPVPAAKPKLNSLFTKWYFWVIVALACAMIFAIALAAISMGDHAAAEDKISQLETELDEKNQLLIKYGAQLGQVVEDSSRPGYEGNKDDKEDDKDNTPADSNNTADYIYVGEWGIKFKIPEGLKNVSYRFANTLHQDAGPDSYPYDITKTLCVSAILDEMDYTPDSFSILEGSFGCLIQAKETDIDQFMPEEIVRIGNDVFRYKYPTGITPIGANEQEQSWGIEITKLIQQMLTNSENISDF